MFKIYFGVHMKKLVLVLLLVSQSWIVVASNELKTAGIISITALGGYVLANKIAEYPLDNNALIGTMAVGMFSGIGMAAGGIYGNARLFCASHTLGLIATKVLDKRSQKETDERRRMRIDEHSLLNSIFYGGGLVAAYGAVLGREQAFLSIAKQ